MLKREKLGRSDHGLSHSHWRSSLKQAVAPGKDRPPIYFL
jgi:hypothetical protein